MTLWAANNLARAVARYNRQGVFLGGIVPNLRQVDAEEKVLAAFADRINARLLPAVSRQAEYADAERRGCTVLEIAPESQAAGELRTLYAAIHATRAADCAPPVPMSDEDFDAFVESVKTETF